MQGDKLFKNSCKSKWLSSEYFNDELKQIHKTKLKRFTKR